VSSVCECVQTHKVKKKQLLLRTEIRLLVKNFVLKTYNDMDDDMDGYSVSKGLKGEELEGERRTCLLTSDPVSHYSFLE